MANALDQAVETAAAQKDVTVPQEGDGGSSALATPSEAPPPSVPSPSGKVPTSEKIGGQPDAPSADDKPAPAKPKGKSTGIPEAERSAAQPQLDAAQFPPVELNGRYMIYPSMALADLNSPQAMAYAVEDRREPGRQLFALICKPGLPVRTS